MKSIRPRPLITLLTDFGTRDAYVASMKGVILSLNPEAALVDLTTRFLLRMSGPGP